MLTLTIPYETKTTLMAHQLDAVNKMLPTRVGGLFMDMGTGKSRTAIELGKIRFDKVSKLIWLCPVSLKETVRREILKHTTCLPRDIYVFDDKTTDRNIPEATWYIVGIESISQSPRVVFAFNNLVDKDSFVICDESAYIKGHRSLRTQRLTYICERAKYRLIMTGTPISQGIVDLYAQMRFLSPKILGYNSFYSFAANHLEYSERFPGMIVRAHNEEYIAAKISPYIYQVTKEECLDLPKKIYKNRYFCMTEEQRKMYDYAKENIFWEWEQTDDPEISSMAIFRLFSVLQQITCGFYNERLDPMKDWLKAKEKNYKFYEFEHHRVDRLAEIIEEIPEQKKVVIFCKFRYDMKGIEKFLADKYGPDSFAVFHGKDRDKEEERFRKEARFFLVNQASGGHGLNLQDAAHYAIFYNNNFKYSERLQAEDRIHRIGQDQTTIYFNIGCTGSIDDRIEDALFEKGNVVAAFKKEMKKVKKKKRKEAILAL